MGLSLQSRKRSHLDIWQQLLKKAVSLVLPSISLSVPSVVSSLVELPTLLLLLLIWSSAGFKLTIAEGGTKGLFLGWAPTAIGYSMQGLCKFGFYEFFKDFYSKKIGEENTYLYQTSLYLAASASAEFFADIALSPMECCKVKMQTSPVGTFPTTLRAAFPKVLKEEGAGSFYKSIVPLWGRQIPYTMMKFACFERTVQAIYANIVPKPRAECTKSEQLVVTFAAGYIAGVFCAIVSHPADTLVSYLNKNQGVG